MIEEVGKAIVVGTALIGMGTLLIKEQNQHRNLKETLAPIVKELDIDRNGELSSNKIQKGLEELAKVRKLRNEISVNK